MYIPALAVEFLFFFVFFVFISELAYNEKSLSVLIQRGQQTSIKMRLGFMF
jgi:hypothetical protein